MKKIFLFLSILILTTSGAIAQKKEKIKGSKFVTVSQYDISDFDSLEILDDLEVYLIFGNKAQVEIEADDNLHETLEKNISGNKLTLSTNKQISGAKKFQVRLTYTSILKLIEVKNAAQLNSLLDLKLNNITVKNYDYSKSYLNVNAANFTLILSDKSKCELNLKSENAAIEANKTANLKALITSANLKIDMYQRAKAEIEGDVSKGKIRLDADTNLIASNTTYHTLDIVTEDSARAKVNVSEGINISAGGRSEIEIYGAPTYTLKKFADKAILYKK